MRRILKFRAWNRIVGRMSEPVLIQDFPKDTQWQNLELLQFTGLFDKAGKEIYEGDILKLTFGRHYWVYGVEAIGGQFGNSLFAIESYSNTSVSEDGNMYTYEITREHAGTRSYIPSGQEVEIIGKVYENPELLNIS